MNVVSDKRVSPAMGEPRARDKTVYEAQIDRANDILVDLSAIRGSLEETLERLDGPVGVEDYSKDQESHPGNLGRMSNYLDEINSQIVNIQKATDRLRELL